MATVVARTGDVYCVPKRFGLRSLLVFTGLFAVCLGLIRWAGLPPVVPIFYVVFLSLIAAAQMIFDRAPRMASISTGIFYLPLCFTAEPAVRAHFQFSHIGEHFFMLAVAGGFLAYLGGTLAAGVFLLSDLVGRCWRARLAPPSTSDPLKPIQPVGIEPKGKNIGSGDGCSDNRPATTSRLAKP